MTGVYRDEAGITRCWWCDGHSDYEAYHDEEWGHPVADDRRLFEKVCLEGFQSGLSWLTILRKRENFRDAFCDFDFHRVARFSERRVDTLLQNEGIVRHRGKITATIHNAARAREMEQEFGSLAAFFWQYEPKARRAALKSQQEARSRTTCDDAIRLAKELRRRGWKFVGPTTAYAFMQAVGMVNDHLQKCACHARVKALRAAFERPV